MTNHDNDLGEIVMVNPAWDTPGECRCGAVLAPMSQWRHAGRDWANIVCETCGWMFVDEDEYLACYPPDGPFVRCVGHDLRTGPHHRVACHYYDTDTEFTDPRPQGDIT